MFGWSPEQEWLQPPYNGGYISDDGVVPSEVANDDCFSLANSFEKNLGNDAGFVENDTCARNVESEFFSYLTTMEDPFTARLGSSSWHNFSPLDASSTNVNFMEDKVYQNLAGVHQLCKDAFDLYLEQESDFLEYEWDNTESFDGFDSVYRNRVITCGNEVNAVENEFCELPKKGAKSPAKSLILPADSSTSWEGLTNSSDLFPLAKGPIRHEDHQYSTPHSTNQVYEVPNLQKTAYEQYQRRQGNVVGERRQGNSLPNFYREWSSLPNDQPPLEYRGGGGLYGAFLPFPHIDQQQNPQESDPSTVHEGESNLRPSFFTFGNSKESPLSSRTMEQAPIRRRSLGVEKPASVTLFPIMTAAEKVEKPKRRRQRQQHVWGVMDSIDGRVEKHGNEGGSVITDQIPPSPYTADFKSGGEYSDPEGIVSQLQKVVAKLDVDSRLVLRDCLFRLGRNATERRDTSTDATSAMNYESCEHNRYMGGKVETDTNSIDRLVAHLLFKKPAP